MIKRLILIGSVFCFDAYGYELSRFTAQKLHQAQQFHQQGDLAKAISLLSDVKSSRRVDQAMVAQTLGLFYWQNGQVAQAVESLKAAVLSEGLEAQRLSETQTMLADIYFNQAEYQKANDLYYKVINTTTPADDRNQLWLKIAKSHYQMDEWQETLHAIENLSSNDKGEKVALLSLKASSQVRLQRWQGAEQSLRALLNLEPSTQNWWKQLVGVQLKQAKTRSALTTLSVAKHQFELSEQENQLYSQLLAKHGVPSQAASVLEKATTSSHSLDQLVLQASLWQQAKEWDRAASVWSQAAQLDARYYSNALKIYMQQRQFTKVLQLIAQAPEQNGELLLMRAQALHKLNKNEQALAFALQADQLESTSLTQSWVDYLKKLAHQTAVESTVSQKNKEES